jgi:hypothetical protein
MAPLHLRHLVQDGCIVSGTQKMTRAGDDCQSGAEKAEQDRQDLLKTTTKMALTARFDQRAR